MSRAGWWQHYLRQTPEDFRAAIGHFKRTVELDPRYGRAYAVLAGRQGVRSKVNPVDGGRGVAFMVPTPHNQRNKGSESASSKPLAFWGESAARRVTTYARLWTRRRRAAQKAGSWRLSARLPLGFEGSGQVRQRPWRYCVSLSLYTLWLSGISWCGCFVIISISEDARPDVRRSVVGPSQTLRLG